MGTFQCDSLPIFHGFPVFCSCLCLEPDGTSLALTQDIRCPCCASTSWAARIVKPRRFRVQLRANTVGCQRTNKKTRSKQKQPPTTEKNKFQWRTSKMKWFVDVCCFCHVVAIAMATCNSSRTPWPSKGLATAGRLRMPRTQMPRILDAAVGPRCWERCKTTSSVTRKECIVQPTSSKCIKLTKEEAYSLHLLVVLVSHCAKGDGHVGYVSLHTFTLCMIHPHGENKVGMRSRFYISATSKIPKKKIAC